MGGAQALLLWAALVPTPAPPPDPSLADLDRFPPPVYVERAVKMNLAHEQYLKERAEAWNTPKGMRCWCLQGAIETDRRCYPWVYLRAAQDEGQTRAYREGQLGQLRGSIGEGAYLLGVMPDPVPWWTLEER